MAETLNTKGRNSKKPTKRSKKPTDQKTESPHSWGALRGIFSCKDHHQAAVEKSAQSRKKCKRIGCSGSLCNSRETSRIMQGPETPSPESHKKRSPSNSSSAGDSSSRSMKGPNETKRAVSSTSSSPSSGSITAASSSASSNGASFRGMHLRRLSGCYECHMADPISGVSRNTSMRVTVLPCPDCGEVFTKSESLELHQSVRHAVSELGPEDTSRNIVEIIFQSSWLKKQPPVCKIDRILKVHNTQKTVSKFEDYRDTIKSKAVSLVKKHPRCVADGNELLRFYCTTFTCSLGLKGSTSLCSSIPHCSVCSIVRDGFKIDGVGKICTMATSGKADDAAQVSGDECGKKRAMLVCRVIAGRVKKSQEVLEECDSAAGANGIYSNLDELFVFNPRAILPCFVVIYSGF